MAGVLEKVGQLDSATATQNAPEAAEFRVEADYLAAAASAETLRELAQLATARGEQDLANLLHQAAGLQLEVARLAGLMAGSRSCT